MNHKIEKQKAAAPAAPTADAARTPRRSAEAGIVKLEKRRTPWWTSAVRHTLNWLIWRGGW